MLVIGCGDMGVRMARQCSKERTVFALGRSFSDALKTMPVQTIRMDLDHCEAWPEFPPQAHWIYTVPPYQGRLDEDERLAAFLERVSDEHLPARLLYFSTSGVYGDHQGAWVDEQTPPQPITDRAKRRWAAEQQITHWCEQKDVDALIVRVPAIVGEGRHKLESLKQGEPILHPDISPISNWVDADFLARACLTLISKAPEGIYNMGDRPPATVTQHYLKLCEQFEIVVPPFIDLETAAKTYSPMRMSFLNESRRLDLSKLANFVPLPEGCTPKET